jgi:hypothetical protein
VTRDQKITLAEMRASGVRGLLIYCDKSDDVVLSGRRHASDQPPPSSTPIPSRQSRNASKTTLGVKDNIMPKNTACKVVMGFRSLDVTFAQDKCSGPPSVATLGLRSAQRSTITSAYRIAHSKSPPGVNRRA